MNNLIWFLFSGAGRRHERKTYIFSNLSIDFKAGFVLTQSTVQINLNIHTTPDTTWNLTRTGAQSCISSCGAGGTPYSNDTNLHLTRLSHHNTLTSKCNKTWPLNHTYTHTHTVWFPVLSLVVLVHRAEIHMKETVEESLPGPLAMSQLLTSVDKHSLSLTRTLMHTRAHTHRHTAVFLMRHVNCVVPGLRRRKSLERSYLVLLMQKTPAEWKITQWHCCWKFDCSVGVKSGHGESTALNTHRMSRRKRACLYLINVEKQLGVAFIWNKYFNKYSMFDTLQSTSK